jgi:hypothetical protein
VACGAGALRVFVVSACDVLAHFVVRYILFIVFFLIQFYMKSFIKVQKRTKKNFMKALRSFVKRKRSTGKRSTGKRSTGKRSTAKIMHVKQ